MLKSDHYFWRLFATGLEFLLFGIGTFVVTMVLVPLTTLVTRDRDQRQKRVRYIIHQSLRLFNWTLRTFGVIELEIKGLENLPKDKPFLLLANHPTLIDVTLIMSLVPQVGCVVKHELANHWLFRRTFRAAHYIVNDHPETLVPDCVQHLNSGNSLVIFPEGTRSLPNQLRRFRRGAARIAVESGCQLVPCLIRCQPPTLLKGEKWYKIPKNRPKFSIDFVHSFAVDHMVEEKAPVWVLSRQVNGHLEEFFRKSLGYEYAIA